jgi:undecaprenyl diphosphate synthase
MDGNGRWAAARGLPRHAGHKAGIAPVRMVIEECSRRGVEALTLFAFSSENWGRPSVEVSGIMNLFLDALERETHSCTPIGCGCASSANGATLPVRLQALVAAAQAQTAGNDGTALAAGGELWWAVGYCTG